MAVSLTPSERQLRASRAALIRWSRSDSRSASEEARRRVEARFEHEVDPDGVLDPAERAKRADRAKRAHMQGLALKSAKARRLKAERGEG